MLYAAGFYLCSLLGSALYGWDRLRRRARDRLHGGSRTPNVCTGTNRWTGIVQASTIWADHPATTADYSSLSLRGELWEDPVSHPTRHLPSSSTADTGFGDWPAGASGPPPPAPAGSSELDRLDYLAALIDPYLP